MGLSEALPELSYKCLERYVMCTVSLIEERCSHSVRYFISLSYTEWANQLVKGGLVGEMGIASTSEKSVEEFYRNGNV